MAPTAILYDFQIALSNVESVVGSTLAGVAVWVLVERPLMALFQRGFLKASLLRPVWSCGRSAAKRKAADPESSLSPTALPAP